MGGMVEAVEQGFPQREIAESAYRFQQAVEKREKQIVGVNAFAEDDEPRVPTLYIDEQAAEAQLARLAAVRARRDQARVETALRRLQEAARGADNTMYPLLDCVRAYATVGEMCDALREVWGEYEEVPSI
jgi:methylmalonyl-CoA mutase N-terminal domain/subunit